MAEEKSDPFTRSINFPLSLMKKLENEATKERRSFSAHVVYILEERDSRLKK